MSARRGRLALAAAVALALGLVLAVGVVVVEHRRRANAPTLEWAPRETGQLLLDDEAVYFRAARTIEIRSLRERSLVRTLPGMPRESYLGVMRDRLVARDRDYPGALDLVSVVTGEVEKSFDVGYFSSLAISRESGVFAVTSTTTTAASALISGAHVTVAIHSLEDGTLRTLCEADVPGRGVGDVRFSPRGDQVTAAILDPRSPRTLVWRLPGGELVGNLPASSVTITSQDEIVGGEVNAKELVVFGPDGAVRRRIPLEAPTLSIFAGDRVLLYRTRNEQESDIGVFDVATNETRWITSQPGGRASFSPSGRTLALADVDGAWIKVWELDH